MAQNLDELFDVVDAQDRVTGKLPRREVHARGLRHRAVHMLVVNGAGRVFLHKRSMAKDLFPGVWDSSAAGHVGAGEDYDGTAARKSTPTAVQDRGPGGNGTGICLGLSRRGRRAFHPSGG